MNTRLQKNGQTWIFFKNAHFGGIFKKMHSLFGAWSFLLVHIRFTPKRFVNWVFFLRNRTTEGGVGSRIMDKDGGVGVLKS